MRGRVRSAHGSGGDADAARERGAVRWTRAERGEDGSESPGRDRVGALTPESLARILAAGPRQVGLFAARGLGDGLISLTLAESLALAGHQVTIHNDPLLELTPLLPGWRLAPWPHPDRLAGRIREFDAVLAMDFTPIAAEYPAEENVVVLQERELDRRRTMVANFRAACVTRLGLPPPPPRPSLRIPAAWRSRVRAERVAMHPQSSEPFRDWPRRRFRSLLGSLSRAGYSPCILVAPRQRKAWMGEQAEVPACPTLMDAARLVYESGYLVGVDSGLGHLASALGIPCLSILPKLGQARLWRPGWGGRISLPRLPRSWIRAFAGRNPVPSWIWDLVWPLYLPAGTVHRDFERLVRSYPVGT